MIMRYFSADFSDANLNAISLLRANYSRFGL